MGIVEHQKSVIENSDTSKMWFWQKKSIDWNGSLHPLNYSDGDMAINKTKKVFTCRNGKYIPYKFSKW